MCSWNDICLNADSIICVPQAQLSRRKNFFLHKYFQSSAVIIEKILCKLPLIVTAKNLKWAEQSHYKE